jgi:hypothetical protein
MWKMYQTATMTSSRPSDLACIKDEWAAVQFDAAVTLVGRTVENALQEQHNVGSEKDPNHQPKYALPQILADDFRFPPSPQPMSERDRQMAAINVLRGWAKMTSAVRDVKPA